MKARHRGRESHHAECLVLTKDDHWILFGVDWSDLWRSFGEGDPPGFHDVPVENRELSAAQAAAWLDENGHEWPEVLRGRSLVEAARTIGSQRRRPMPTHGRVASKQGRTRMVASTTSSLMGSHTA